MLLLKLGSTICSPVYCKMLLLLFLILRLQDVDCCGPGGGGGNGGTGGGTGGFPALLGGTANLNGPLDTECDGEPIDRDSDLDCLNWPCLWRNVGTNEDDIDLFEGEGSPDPSLLAKYTGTRTLPDEPYAVIFPDESLNSEDRAFLVSCPVSCQDGSGTLRLNHWITDNAKLEVCTRLVGDLQPDNCFDVDRDDNPGPTSIRIPSYSEPFELLLQATGFTSDKDFVLIDDIEYEAQLCDPIIPTEPPLVDDGEACRYFQCDFSQGSQCANEARSSNGWDLGSGVTGNLVTGIIGDATSFNRQGGSYAFAEGPANGPTISFPDVDFGDGKELLFQFYKASFNSIFEVNIDGQPVFRADDTRVSDRSWRQSSVSVPPGRHQVSFIADNLEENSYVGLDDLRIRDGSGRDLC